MHLERSLPGVVIRLVKQQTNEFQSGTSDEQGRFSFLLLSPQGSNSRRRELRLSPATKFETIQVSAEKELIQTDSYTLGKVVNETGVSGLPLVTRNFVQIASLSPGVETGVYNAGELGLGGTRIMHLCSPSRNAPHSDSSAQSRANTGARGHAALRVDCLNAKSGRSTRCYKKLNSAAKLIQRTTSEAPQRHMCSRIHR
jgi:hypothetical protein